ncbi:MAG TPA: choice-of-anchor L domain-containing protein [Polyangiaceae bacterium]|nr:choice-of-anchor L domain-containing protein [Polyangiaceae bacterium]
MRSTTLLFWMFASISAVACSGGSGSGFGKDGGGGGGGGDGGGGGGGDSGCPFCGIDGSASDGGGGGGGCNPNPLNYDIPGNNCDDDGDGTVDNPQGACDQGLAQTGPASDFAKAMGLCQTADATHWGVVSATYTQGYNSTNAPDAHQHGIQPKFGTNVTARQGSALGILSSGYAQNMDSCPGNTTGQDKGFSSCRMTGAGTPPPGYPKAAQGCPGSTVANDVSAVTLKIKVPANAQGFAFDFNFFSGEWPEYVCTNFNDSFVAWLTSSAWQGKSNDFNISFDGNGNPVSVNNGFFDVCSPAGLQCPSMPSASTCKLGATELAGTGFFISGDNQCGQTDSGGGATGWLTTQAPVAPGETITLQLMIWDTGDQIYDSSVLLDNWSWAPSATTVSTNRPPN